MGPRNRRHSPAREEILTFDFRLKTKTAICLEKNAKDLYIAEIDFWPDNQAAASPTPLASPEVRSDPTKSSKNES
jgi:hypothetical protein